MRGENEMSDLPKVSVIIPVYNAEKYLRQCLDSVTKQTLKNIEIICVDDCSTDSSPAIVQEYVEMDSRVVLISNTQNMHAGLSRNLGIVRAKGEYIHFLDADDYLVENAYEVLYHLAHSNELDLIRACAYDLDDRTLTTYTSKVDALENVPNEIFNKVITFRLYPEVFTKISVAPWAGLYRRDFLAAHNIFFNNLMCVNDRSFYSECIFKAKRIMICNTFFLYYRVNNSNSLVGNRAKYFDCHFKSYNIISELSKEFPANIQRFYLENELYDICYWLKKLVKSEYGDIIQYQTLNFIDKLDDSLWEGYANQTRWYRTIHKICKPLRKYESKVVSPKVTIIMPVYNSQKYLRQAMTSVMRQSMEELELICIDDGSDDDSYRLLQFYAMVDKRIVVLQQEHKRAGAARNLGIDYANGEYITFLDSDDIMMPNALENLYQCAISFQADVVISAARFFACEAQSSQPANWVLKQKYIKNRTEISINTDPDIIFQITSGEPWSKLFNRNFIIKSKILFPDLPRSEDAYFVYLSYACANKIAILKQETVMYRRIPGQGLEESKDSYPLSAYKSRLMLKNKLNELGIYQIAEKSFINNVLDMVVHNLKSFKTLNAFTVLYNEFRNSIIPSLAISFSDADFFYDKSNFEFAINLVQSRDLTEFLFYLAQRNFQDVRVQPERIKRIEKSMVEVELIRKSISYRIGRFITFIPRKIRVGIRCYQEHGMNYTVRRIKEKFLALIGR